MAKIHSMTALSTKGLAATGGNAIGLFITFAFESAGLPISATWATFAGMAIATAFWYLTPEKVFDTVLNRYKDRVNAQERLINELQGGGQVENIPERN